ncbi:MAG TPA: aromatic ring-hydroxylating dioxygenase subunit alpha [Pusillimonas sp.]|uniref:aromatic ring-hydroxylating dioxygenase subunit alpha n=1 Tax=Pusillimonas sp. TaxID=3040095 RepID=UPI002CDDB5B6|nr:aromatic ring-hydroxylating dioxygenase subunit alpha [Pusillimonas sp.]HUH87063.1 aromatic ring-hydroxylating dioxygenase subunit alpha [Pusillimonas sp.]
MFITNAWYVAAWGDQVGRALKQITIIGEPIVLYRTEAGDAVALDDRCPHRRASLSKGRLVGDDVQCGYHGITFNCAGSCVSIPGQDKIPSGMKVRRYPVIERWQWIWIWMGDPDAADESLLPANFRYNDEPGWVATGGSLPVKANYQLLTDNLLDLTHETYVHGKTIGNASVVETPMEYEVRGDEVHVSRIMRNTPPPPLFKRVGKFEGNIDRWQLIRFQMPAHISIDARGYPAGSDDLQRGMRWFSLNSITPVDARSSVYFWTITRCFDLNDQDLSSLINEKILATFLEDVEVLEAQQKLIETDRRGLDEVSIRADSGSISARRIVKRLSEQPQTVS